MEIDKVVFENLKSLNAENNFEELDINNDGVINAQDAKETHNTALKEQIQKTLNYIDTENEDLVNDEDFKTALTNLEDVQTSINNINEEISSIKKLIEKKEAKKEELEKEQEAVKKEIAELQDNLSLAKDDDAKRSIQKQIISKSVENLALLEQINSISRTIHSKTSLMDSLATDLVKLEDKETSLATEVETIKINVEKEAQQATREANCPKNEYGLSGLNSQNFEQAFEGQEGVQYVVLSLPSCGRCHNLMKQLASELSAEELQSVAAYDLFDQADSRKYMEQIAANVGGKIPGGYPKLLKLVNGVPSEIIEFSGVANLKQIIKKGISENS